jgi:putative membrane protein
MIGKMMLVTASALLACAFSARAEDKPPAAAFEDGAFVKVAAIDGMSEVHLGQLAATQAKGQDVKDFAGQAAKDHAAANEGLKEAAKAAGIEVPAKIDEAHQKQYDAFKDYKGDDFDRDYAKTMVQSHTESVALYTRASKEAKDQGIKDYATKTLPTLQKHLEAAKKLNR